MDYAATMAAVRAVARYLTAFVAHDETKTTADPALWHNDTAKSNREKEQP